MLAGIVTYNPEMNRLKQNLDSVCRQCEKVVIIENHSDNRPQIIELLSRYKNISLILNDKNMGIAFGMNQIGSMAQSLQEEWFVTLDQDSVCAKDMLKTLLSQAPKDAVILAPVHIPFSMQKQKGKGCNGRITEVPYVISSGNCVRTNYWKAAGGFWNLLFVDQVDHEFCYRAGRMGYKIYQNSGALLYHVVGSPAVKKLFLWNIRSENHSAFRKYYQARNITILRHMYPYEFGTEKKNLITYGVMILLVFLMENDKTAKIRSILKGRNDARRWIKIHKELKVPGNFNMVNGAVKRGL